MAKATPIATFSDELITELEKSLKLNLSNARRKSLERILHEWAQFDLPEHLSREPRSIVRKRLARAESVKKHALELSKALDALDDTDRFVVTHLVERRHGESRAEIARQRNRLVEGTQFISDLGAIAPSEFWKLKGPRARTLAAYLVLLDAAAIFEWLTGSKATRVVGRVTGAEEGKFYRFVAVLWPAVFGSGRTGLKSAIKNWAGWHRKHKERSALITNIALRKRLRHRRHGTSRTETASWKVSEPN
jgi:hypothetical protein